MSVVSYSPRACVSLVDIRDVRPLRKWNETIRKTLVKQTREEDAHHPHEDI
jgi:hypothetical protein